MNNETANVPDNVHGIFQYKQRIYVCYFRFSNGLFQLRRAMKQKSKKVGMKMAFRQKFEAEMKNLGLELEYSRTADTSLNDKDDKGNITFIKIHSSWTALTRQAEFEVTNLFFCHRDNASCRYVPSAFFVYFNSFKNNNK